MAETGAFLVGIDVGGTFTDLLAVDRNTGAIRLAKVPTTPDNQAEGFVAALRAAGITGSAIEVLVHGTTTTTNALLERKIARVGLVTTEGFRDVLELGRRTRPNSYGLTGSFEPLIERPLRHEVPERMDAEGQVVTPLDEAALRAVVPRLLAQGCEAVVIHFLHSYINPAHERQALEIVRSLWPNRFVTAGHTVVSEYREYERGVTATVNAAVQPVLDRYLTRLVSELRGLGFSRDLLVMQGNGGTVAAQLAATHAVNTVMSGPASGVMAAAETGLASSYSELITYDMGGTSTDVGVVRGGVPQVSSETELEYAMPVHVPMVDVHTIGAGGGSIAEVDAAGILHVGPRSAGAHPGPICYGRGGAEPTITDANLVLGRLDPQKLLAVDAPVSLETVRDAIQRRIGDRLGLDWTRAAAAILRVANDRMAGAIRLVSLSRGYDPRDFALFAFGGAGPMHAAALARELAIPRLLIPARPGITNALGCVVADFRHDFVRTVNRPLDRLDPAVAPRILREQMAEGEALLRQQGSSVQEVRHLHFADMQFQGQSHMLSVPLASADVAVEDLRTSFDKAYWRRFEVELPEIRAVLVNLHTATIGKRQSIDLALLGAGNAAPDLAGAIIGRRRVWFADGGWLDTPILARERLPAGGAVGGPAIIVQLDTTIVLEPGNIARLDRVGNLVVEVGT